MQKNYVASGNMMGALLNANKQKVSGYLDIGEAYPFDMEVKLKQKKQKSARKGMRGQIIDSGAIIDEITGSIGIKNWIAKNIAMLVSGVAVALTAASGTVSATDITLPDDGSWVSLGHRNVSSILISGKAEGTDFEVNPVIGFIRGIGATTGVVSVAYEYAGQGGYKVDIGSAAVIRMALIIDGQNDEDDQPFIAEFDSVVFISKSPLILISDPETDYEKMEFDLVFETLPGKTSPGTINGFAI
ncbi:MAG: hypothetical protein COA36_11745 [Desulfotalea sp.]|nr:MAG: hypothetical protein COA36_11745 [Desulfotalea sp.]